MKMVAIFLSAAALTGCGATPETTRAAATVQVPQAAALSALARQFQAETPYFVNFDFDVDGLDAEARSKLDVQAAWIIDHPDVKFRVYGHADQVGNTDYNTKLGMRRASNAVAYLVSKGISETRLEAVVSFGENTPVINSNDRERANRRVVTEVFAFLVPVTGANGQIELVAISATGPVPVPGGTAVPTSAPTPTTTPTVATTPTSTHVSTPTTSPEPVVSNGPTTSPAPAPTSGSEPKAKKPNSGRGNGDEVGDPGKSGGKNNGGDDV